MVWLLIIFVLAVALVPLMHFAPSKRQRQVARIREQAAIAGLFVEFREPPGGAERPWPEQVNAAAIIYYGKRLPARRAGRIASAGWRRDDGDWCAVGGYVPVPEVLPDLPACVVAASVDDGSCGVYWTEVEEEAEIEQICSALERWSAQLCDIRK